MILEASDEDTAEKIVHSIVKEIHISHSCEAMFYSANDPAIEWEFNDDDTVLFEIIEDVGPNEEKTDIN
jgi:hypothetical protein